MATDFTKKMLKTIREGVERTKVEKATVKPLPLETVITEEDNFFTRAKILMEEAENQKKNLNEGKEFDDVNHEKSFPITKKTPQFGDVRVSQEESILKTIGPSSSTQMLIRL